MKVIEKDMTIAADCEEQIPLVRHYTDEEKDAFAREAALLNEEVTDLKEQKAEATKSFNDSIKEKETMRNSLSSKVRKGFEQYVETCSGYLENIDGRWYMVFYDSTGTEVNRRIAKPSERQLELGRTGSHG